MMPQNDLVLREGARLVGAQDVHCAEVLNCVEALDDDPLARHHEGALGEIDRHNHWQHFRRQCDRDGERKHQRLSQSLLVSPLMTKTLGAMTGMKRIISQVNRVTPLSKLVGARCRISVPANSPKYVWVPVWMTTAVPAPLRTLLA
jgi:hypothetical protein